jgi:hypothetical protein
MNNRQLTSNCFPDSSTIHHALFLTQLMQNLATVVHDLKKITDVSFAEFRDLMAVGDLVKDTIVGRRAARIE